MDSSPTLESSVGNILRHSWVHLKISQVSRNKNQHLTFLTISFLIIERKLLCAHFCKNIKNKDNAKLFRLLSIHRPRLFHLSFGLGVQYTYPFQCGMLALFCRQGYPVYPWLHPYATVTCVHAYEISFYPFISRHLFLSVKSNQGINKCICSKEAREQAPFLFKPYRPCRMNTRHQKWRSDKHQHRYQQGTDIQQQINPDIEFNRNPIYIISGRVQLEKMKLRLDEAQCHPDDIPP